MSCRSPGSVNISHLASLLMLCPNDVIGWFVERPPTQLSLPLFAKIVFLIVYEEFPDEPPVCSPLLLLATVE